MLTQASVVSGNAFVVLAQSATPPQPRECSLNHPSARQYVKLVAIPGTPHDFKRPSRQLPHPLDQFSGVACVSPDQAHTPKSSFQFTYNQLRAISVLSVSGMHRHLQQQPCGIHYDVLLSTFDLLARVITARPPFSVVFTDWLSMIAALGVGFLPSVSRTSGRRVSLTRFHVRVFRLSRWP